LAKQNHTLFVSCKSLRPQPPDAANLAVAPAQRNAATTRRDVEELEAFLA
jgi:hypothetical protein